MGKLSKMDRRRKKIHKDPTDTKTVLLRTEQHLKPSG